MLKMQMLEKKTIKNSLVWLQVKFVDLDLDLLSKFYQ